MKSVQRKDRNHKKYTKIGYLLHITATPVTTKAGLLKQPSVALNDGNIRR